VKKAERFYYGAVLMIFGDCSRVALMVCFRADIYFALVDNELST